MDVTYAYVRNGDANIRGNVHRVLEGSLHSYLLDPIRMPVLGEDGKPELKEDGTPHMTWVPYNFPMKPECPVGKTVREFRQELEDKGWVFQFTEVTEDEWHRDQD